MFDGNVALIPVNPLPSPLKEPVNDPVNGDVIVVNCNELLIIFDGTLVIPL